MHKFFHHLGQYRLLLLDSLNTFHFCECRALRSQATGLRCASQFYHFTVRGVISANKLIF